MSNSAMVEASTGSELARTYAPVIRDKIVLVTGVSPGGLGASFVAAIAPHQPRQIILAGRNQAKLSQTVDDIHAKCPDAAVRTLVLDLASQKSIRDAAATLLADDKEPVDVLVNNAGIMAVPYATTPEGIEMQFGANHIGHFLFTNLIMARILASSSGGRIINIGSSGYRHSAIRFADLGFQGGKVYNRIAAYGQSKTANMLFSVELARRLGHKGIISLSVHPGAVSTNIIQNSAVDLKPFWEEVKQWDAAMGTKQPKPNPLNLDQGTCTHIYAAFDPALAQHNGAFCQQWHVVPPEQIHCWGRDPFEATQLWKVSEELVGQVFEYGEASSRI